MTNNVIDLNAYRKSLDAKNEQNKPWLLAEESKEKVIALIDRKSFNFRKSIESETEFRDLMNYLKNLWIKDLKVCLKDWTEIVDAEQAVWQDSFIFSEEATIFLFELLAEMHKESVTPTWETLIIAR